MNTTMMKETKLQTRVRVGVEELWRALSKDMWMVLPKVLPDSVKDVVLHEGDGGPNTIIFINFVSDGKNGAYQKEKVVEFDETKHRIGLQIIGGGYLDHGFASYTTIFQLSTEVGTAETIVEITIAFDSETKETTVPLLAAKTAGFLHCLDNYLLQCNV